jgi:hypothetical protein
MKIRKILGMLATCWALAVLGACSDDDGGSSPSTTPPPPPPSTYTVGGTVSGLSSGAKVTLQNNGGNSLTVSANGAFTFTTALAGGAAYAVTVSTQPAGESCKATSASGTVGSADVTNVAIACTVTPVAAYSVGGTISGLTGSAQVTIELNGAGPLAAPNGSFHFAAMLKSGAPYAVTIVTQPSGATCTLGNATGTIAAANITNVSVSCTVNGGGGAGGAFWIPFSATPVTGTTGGKSGLFLIASTAIADDPAPTPAWVTTHSATLLGLALDGFIDGSTLPTSETPAVMIYAAAGADGNTHLYGLNLAYSSGTPPVPTQITNLSVPASMNVCSAGQLENDVATPTSLAVVVYVVTPVSGATPGTEGYCPAGGTYELAHYSDSPATAPVVVNIPGGTTNFSALVNDGAFNALYQNAGNLSGVALWDSADSTLNFYPGESFAGPSTVVADMSQPVSIFSRTVEYGVAWTGGDNYLFSGTTSGTAAAYRMNASGSAVAFFFGTVAGAVRDDNSLYFIGYQGSSTTPAIYKEPLSFGSVADVLSTALPVPSASAGSTLIWSNDSVLIFENYSVSGSGSASYSLRSVPVGTTSTSATTIAGPIAGNLATAFMASPSGTDTAADILFLTTINQSGGATQFSSQVLTAGGTVQQTTPNAVLGSFGTLTTELLGDIWEIQGITDTSGGYGGGTLAQLNVGTLAKTTITATGGAGYTIPAGYGMSMTGFYGTGIAVAQLYSKTSSNFAAGAIDVSQHAILPLSLANTNVSPML